jgi:hypothetical protein
LIEKVQKNPSTYPPKKEECFRQHGNFLKNFYFGDSRDTRDTRDTK